MKTSNANRMRSGLAAVLFTLVMLAGGAAPAFSSEAGDGSVKIAGNYVCFEEQDEKPAAVLRQGVLTIRDGRIEDIKEMADPAQAPEEALVLDDTCVMFPGLLDIHSHIEYNYFQLWKSQENARPWDNRFEWRASAQERADLRDKEVKVVERWEEPLPDTENALLGDLIEYFAELQGAAGGTTLIQGYNQTDAYDTADSHEKVDLIRDTCCAKDLGVGPGEEVTCLIQIFRPDMEFSQEDPASYLPDQDTAAWALKEQVNAATEKTCLEELLESIGEKRTGGYLIHLAEGRAGNHLANTDPYSDMEFETFKNAITAGVSEGRFSAEDVRNAHIGLIHACAVDLSDEDDYRFVKEYGIGLLWAPVSNLLLYEDTPSFGDYLGDDDLLVGIGSDWSPSGSKTVWDECKFAFTYMQGQGHEPAQAAQDLLKACTYTAARIIGHPEFGNIAAGAAADLFILRGEDAVEGELKTALDTFIRTDDGGVEAVLVGGRPVYGEASFIRAYAGEEAFSSYGTYDSGVPELAGKYCLLPELFAGMSFEEAYETYCGVLADEQIEPSRLRAMEDPVYREVIEQLKEQFCK